MQKYLLKSIFSLEFIFSIFLRFRKFQHQYSNKVYSINKKKRLLRKLEELVKNAVASSYPFASIVLSLIDCIFPKLLLISLAVRLEYSQYVETYHCQ